MELSQLDEVGDAFGGGLDVAVENGGVGEEAEGVGGAVDLEPLVGADLALEGLVVDAIVEDLFAAAGEGAEARFLQVGEHGAKTFEPILPPLTDAGEMHDLDRRERLDVQCGCGLENGAKHVGVVGEG